MKKEQSVTNGFSLIEAVLAGSILAVFLAVFSGIFLYGQKAALFSGKRARAVLLAKQGLEAARGIRDENFSGLIDGVYGLAVIDNKRVFSGSSDEIEIFSRSVAVSSVSEGLKKIVSRVIWPQSGGEQGEAVLSTYLSDWQSVLPVFPVDCSNHCQSLGYVSGVCRKTPANCNQNGEVQESQGNKYCTSDKNANICCCQP